jgi:hypothetical protein
MPKVVMLVSMAAANWSLVPGDVTEVIDEVSEAWVENGIAKLYEPHEVKAVEINNDVMEPEELELIDTNQEESIPVDPIETPTVSMEPNIDAGEEQGIKHVGGGWYLLPNGEKVQGKDEALEALKSLNV